MVFMIGWSTKQLHIESSLVTIIIECYISLI